MLSAIKSILPKRTEKYKKTKCSKETTQAQNSSNQPKYKSTTGGAFFGIGAGLGDGYITVYSTKQDVKKAIAEYKASPFAQKKAAIEGLHQKGINVKQYKTYMNDIQKLSAPKTMIRRALIYGAFATLTGLVIDTYRNSKNKNSAQKK